MTAHPRIGGAQQRPATRALGPALATSAPLGAVSGVRALTDGRVLVNDPVRRQLLLLDSAMKVVKVVADTTSATQKAYGTTVGGLLPYRGDSSLFVDPASYSMLVIDPDGNVARVIAAPSPEDVSSLLGGPRGGDAGFDARGRLVYRNSFNLARAAARTSDQSAPQQPADSAPIIRFDLATRKRDTAAFTRIPATKLAFVHTDAGQRVVPVINPLQLVDDWAMLPDGTIAILRSNYRLQLIGSNDSSVLGPAIPFPWQRLTDSAKAALIDSVQAAMATRRAAPDAGRAVMITNTGGRAATRSVATRSGAAPQVRYVSPSELPDYRPAFAMGAMHADAEGRLWVRTTAGDPITGAPEYDVIDRTGKLLDCVTIPRGTTIAGFAAGGVVYLGVRDSAGVHLVRAREK
jgi:hypothetical protein